MDPFSLATLSSFLELPFVLLRLELIDGLSYYLFDESTIRVYRAVFHEPESATWEEVGGGEEGWGERRRGEDIRIGKHCTSNPGSGT